MSSTIAVVTDSAASLPPALVDKWGIRVVPLHVIVDEVSHREGVDIGADDVLAALTADRDVSTSQPGATAFIEVFDQCARDGAEAVVAVLISSAMSGTFEGAQAAAEHASVPVTVVDSRSLAMGTGFAAIAAASAVAAGFSAADAADEARRVASSARCIFTVDTLTYLRRGGRVSPAIAAVGGVLNLRPVLELVEGEVVMVERVRSTRRARDAVMARAEAAVDGMGRPAAAVMVLGEGDFGDEAARALEARHESLAKLVRTPVSAVLASHTGPGTLAAVVVDLPTHVT